MDNKFGKCCKCPARMDSMRQYTEYESQNVIMADVMKKKGFKTIHEYNEWLEINGWDNAIASMKWQEANHKCQRDDNNVFYPNTSDDHARFEAMLNAIPQEDVVPLDPFTMKGVLSTQDRANYTSGEICNDRPLFTMAKPLGGYK